MPLDPAYQTVAPEEFPSMLEPARYATRSPHFEEIIARTEEHFWNPEDPDYIRFDTPWPADEPILPPSFVIEAHTAVCDSTTKPSGRMGSSADHGSSKRM